MIHCPFLILMLVKTIFVIFEYFNYLEFSDSFSSTSEKSDKSNSSSASTIILDEVPNKRQRKEDTSALSAKQVRTKFLCDSP